MGRKSRNTVQFFPHFVKEGKTIYILERNFGIKGYVFWFKLLELLGSTEDHYVDFKDVDTREYFLAKAQVESDLANKILEKLAQLGQIDKELWSYQIIWSQNFVENLTEVYRKRKRQLPKKPELSDIKNGFSSQGVAENPQDQSNLPQLSAESTHSRVEYSRENKSKIEESIEKEKIGIPEGAVEMLKDRSMKSSDFFNEFPFNNLDNISFEIVNKILFTGNPKTTLKPDKDELQIIKRYLIIGGDLGNLYKSIEGAEISDRGKTEIQLSQFSEKRNVTAEYITTPKNQARLIRCWDMKQAQQESNKTPEQSFRMETFSYDD